MFRIYVYHGVVKRTDAFDRFFGKNISVKNFREQIITLKKKRKILSLGEFEKKWKERSLKGDEAMIFFDDCYQSSLSGLKILYKLKIPAVLAISTDLVNKGYSWTDDVEKIIPNNFDKIIKFKKYLKTIPASKILKELEKIAKIYGVDPRQNNQEKFRIISWSEIKKIKSLGLCDIVHHSHWHYPMSKLSRKNLIKDIEMNVKILKNKTGDAPKYFVYPFGQKNDYDREVIKILKMNGFSFAFNTAQEEITYYDNFAIPRSMATS